MKGRIRPRDRRKKVGGKKPCRRWQLVVDDLRDEAGKRKQRYQSFEGTEAEEDRALRRFIGEVETGFASESGVLTVAEYMERWLAHVATIVRSRSLVSYRQLSEMHIVPYIGALKLRELRPMRVQSLYDKLLKGGRRTKKGGKLSKNSVLHVHRVLFAALRQAVRWRLVSINVAEAVSPPHRSVSGLYRTGGRRVSGSRSKIW